jgi:hypothetical protein
VFDLIVQRPAGVLAEYASDVVIEFGVLAIAFCWDQSTSSVRPFLLLGDMHSWCERREMKRSHNVLF